MLIKYASEEVVTLKVLEPNSHASYFVIFNIWEKKIHAVFSNTSKKLLYLMENFCDSFRNVKLSSETQYSCSPSNNMYAYLHQQRFKRTIIGAKGGGVTGDLFLNFFDLLNLKINFYFLEATKRLLAQLPISAQSYSSSPYLDLSLFAYDDKWVSIMERPKQFAEYPIRYN